ncbi:hypothetical protein GCM10010273_10530 [Streptomyces lavendulocolor]
MSRAGATSLRGTGFDHGRLQGSGGPPPKSVTAPVAGQDGGRGRGATAQGAAVAVAVTPDARKRAFPDGGGPSVRNASLPPRAARPSPHVEGPARSRTALP